VARHEFTNMSALLLVTSVLVFLIGLISERITTLAYRETSADRAASATTPPTRP
jgi:hypothetical protein